MSGWSFEFEGVVVAGIADMELDNYPAAVAVAEVALAVVGSRAAFAAPVGRLCPAGFGCRYPLIKL